MAAYNLAAFRAAPFYRFLFQKLIDAMLIDEFKVLNHAHVVKGAVALIEGAQALTGKIFAIVTKAN